MMISLTVWKWLSENIIMKNESIIIYSHLSRSKELVFRREENDVTVKIQLSI